MNLKFEHQTEFGRYKLAFADDFDGHALDVGKWVPYYLPQWSSREAAWPSYRLQGGALILEIAPEQKPWCPEFNGAVRVSSLQTGLYAGPLGSALGQHRFSPACRVRQTQPTLKTYTPQYGYFELRAKCHLAASNVAAFWMIGFEDHPERSAEICIFELNGHNVQAEQATIGYGLHPFGDKTITDEFYEEPFKLNAAEYNVYAAEWTASAVHFYINQVKVKTIAQAPQYPMQWMLNIYDLADPAEQAGPMEFWVDYVAGYAPAM